MNVADLLQDSPSEEHRRRQQQRQQEQQQQQQQQQPPPQPIHDVDRHHPHPPYQPYGPGPDYHQQPYDARDRERDQREREREREQIERERARMQRERARDQEERERADRERELRRQQQPPAPPPFNIMDTRIPTPRSRYPYAPGYSEPSPFHQHQAWGPGAIGGAPGVGAGAGMGEWEKERVEREREREREVERQREREREREREQRERMERERESILQRERERERAEREREKERERAERSERKDSRRSMDEFVRERERDAAKPKRRTAPSQSSRQPSPDERDHKDMAIIRAAAHTRKQQQAQPSPVPAHAQQAVPPHAPPPPHTLDTSPKHAPHPHPHPAVQHLLRPPPDLAPAPGTYIHLGTFVHPDTPFPYFFPPLAPLPSTRRKRAAPPPLPQTRATILIPAAALPAGPAPGTLRQTTHPRVWGGGLDAAAAASLPVPVVVRMQRVYTDDSDLFLCALHAGCFTWSMARAARAAGRDLRIELRVIRCGVRGVGVRPDAEGEQEWDVVWRFVGGWGNPYYEEGQSPDAVGDSDSDLENDGRGLLSASWGTGHDGSGIEILSAKFVENGVSEPGLGLRTRAQRLREYGERRAAVMGDVSVGLGAQWLRKRRRSALYDTYPELAPEAECAATGVLTRGMEQDMPRSELELCAAHALVFGLGREAGEKPVVRVGFKYDPQTLRDVLFPDASAESPAKKLKIDADADEDAPPMDTDAQPDEGSTDAGPNAKQPRAVLLDSNVGHFSIVPHASEDGAGWRYTVARYRNAASGSSTSAMGKATKEDNDAGKGADAPKAPSETPGASAEGLSSTADKDGGTAASTATAESSAATEKGTTDAIPAASPEKTVAPPTVDTSVHAPEAPSAPAKAVDTKSSGMHILRNNASADDLTLTDQGVAFVGDGGSTRTIEVLRWRWLHV